MTLLTLPPLVASTLPLVWQFPNLDPVALSLGPIFGYGPVEIKWYGLAYMAGLLLGWLYIRRLLSEPKLWPHQQVPFEPAAADDLLIYMTVGVIVGGRLGSVLLYEPGLYLKNPLEIFMLWKGGMAFHGALLGCGLAIYLFARKLGVSVLSTMDVCAASVPLGLFFGRLANFINGELWGRPTQVPWAMVFPGAAKQFPELEPTGRHPSQLYEAMLEGLALFLVLRVLTHHKGALETPGLVTGMFLLGYALARSFCEIFRQPDVLHALTIGPLTPGQIYSIPMGLLGLYFLRQARLAHA